MSAPASMSSRAATTLSWDRARQRGGAVEGDICREERARGDGQEKEEKEEEGARDHTSPTALA